ncbi:hypothetical protein R1sor_012485 [Riccia sorocarpa]|uniref:Uncharacterized protein n=1 Tax=Riccia sorocarpa TaxID=122646 RepID=A0ABD3I5T0_9MARC
MSHSKNHPYSSMNLRYGHPRDFNNELNGTNNQTQEVFPSQIMSSMFSTRARRITLGIILMGLLAVLNLGAFFAALRMGLVFYPPDEGPFAGSLHGEPDFEVCLMISVGDDRDQPNDKAVPFSEINRLIDPFISEIKDRPPGTKVLLAADYTSVTCKMVRDRLEEEEVSDAVESSCQTPGEVYKSILRSGKQRVTCGVMVIGESSNYVPQLTLEWAQLIQWQTLRVVNLDEEVPSRSAPQLPQEMWQPTVVTAFSGNHFPVAALLLRSLAKAGQEAADAGLYNISVVVYSIEKFNSTLQGIFDCVVREMNEVYHVSTEARVFNFSAVPEWMRLDPFRPYNGTGEYAWKVAIIHQILVERGFVIWSDAGNRFTFHGLVETLNTTLAHGFTSRNTVGILPHWVHPGMLKYFRYNFHHDPPVPNCDGSSIGLTLDKYEKVMRPWYECSQTRQCLAPDGSSRLNHRQDQSALTIVTSMNGLVCQGISGSVKRHMDGHSTDYVGTNPTACYTDPLQVVPPDEFFAQLGSNPGNSTTVFTFNKSLLKHAAQSSHIVRSLIIEKVGPTVILHPAGRGFLSVDQQGGEVFEFLNLPFQRLVPVSVSVPHPADNTLLAVLEKIHASLKFR